MGKKRIVKKKGGGMNQGLKSRSLSRVPKKRMEAGILHIKATYNNTILMLTDKEGGAVIFSSCGALGFSGARKGTPFAAAKVGELVGEKAALIGVKDVDVVIKGVGSGRESSLRAFSSKGIKIKTIKDMTPIPFNGPRAKKPRRV
ncbi:30S ribosomal protein S11 [Patescibacteria group bacterium]|nr:30S ribosomal protein S11 [Patescibacteria group bacterium]MCH8888991.1 30S ribosomal protein S11 [Patescibacteria group bacterium]